MANGNASNFLISEAHLALDAVRKEKAERTNTLGSPIHLSGKALDITIRGANAWIAENNAVARTIDLESGKTLHLYKGHTGPVTTLAFCDKEHGSSDGKILVTGSWDKTIKLWDTESKNLISSTEAHADFVKSLLVLPSLQLLISGGSDKMVRFWDLSTRTQNKSLRSMGSISSHVRPVECLDGKAISDASALLYTADTMGVIRVWELTKESGPSPRWRSVLQEELNHHRTRVNQLMYGSGQLWTASSDETVQLIPDTSVSPIKSSKPLPIPHPVAVKSILPLSLTDLLEPYLITGAGDVIRVYDVSSAEEPELISETDAHWHDVTAIRLWIRKFVGDDEKPRIEPWIVSTSLDSTIRKWKLSELLRPISAARIIEDKKTAPVPPSAGMQFQMTDEEERELAELLDSD